MAFEGRHGRVLHELWIAIRILDLKQFPGIVFAIPIPTNPWIGILDCNPDWILGADGSQVTGAQHPEAKVHWRAHHSAAAVWGRETHRPE